jgi:two-component system, OmpR family, sensor histidine kinase KdpD
VGFLGRRRRTDAAHAAELAALQAELAATAEERDRAVAETARIQALERIDEQRSALLRSVSHDLRTPLATIKAVATDLRAGDVHDEATRRELLDSVVDEVERLDRLVANLLTMSRIEAGVQSTERQAVDVDELVRDRVGELVRLFEHVRVQVDVPEDLPLVQGDYTELEQVVTNLLQNAARYAPPGSMVTVSGRDKDGDVELVVADEGIGVPHHERSRIFEPFRRGEGSRSSGVGLAICKAVVEGHGGTIEVERTPGGGATFIVTLPGRRG